VSVEPHRFPGIYKVTEDGRTNFATRSLVPSQSVYGEKIIKTEEGEFRLWSMKRSKLAAAIQNGLSEMPIQPGSRVLYLGASSGTTVSHVSDIVGPEGVVYAVEFSATIARGLIRLATSRSNIMPIIDDARHPTRYAPLVSGQVDVAYQDIAQPDQARILHDNTAAFCSYGAWAMIAIKARSIDSTSDVNQIYSREFAKLDTLGFEVIEKIDLEPFDRDHVFAVCRVREDMK
jgi:fibrillarin-like pre-rRNA processing protein